jgi:hypothetical protein
MGPLALQVCSTAATHVAVDAEGNICASLLEGGSSGIDPVLLQEGLLQVQKVGMMYESEAWPPCDTHDLGW